MLKWLKLQAVKFITVGSAFILLGLIIGCIESLKVTWLSFSLLIITMAIMVLCGLYVARKEGFEL